MDASADWFETYVSDYSVEMPLMQHADDAFERFEIGPEISVWPPVYIAIDKQGIIRHRSVGLGSVSVEAMAHLVGELVDE